MATKPKAGGEADESTFDVLFRRALRISALLGFFALLVVYVGLGREVSAAWLFLIAGMFGLDGLTGAIKASK